LGDDLMPYDPNDPNQGSQAPAEDQATPEWQAKNATTSGTINDFIRSRPAVQIWLSGHNGGRNLSDGEQQQFFSLLKQQGIDPTNLEIDNNGVVSWPMHNVRDIALGSLLAFGPVAAAWAIPAAAGAIGGGGTAALGPSTAENIAATAAASNAAAPAALSTGLSAAAPAAAGAGASAAAPTAAGGIPPATYGPGGVVTNFAGVAPEAVPPVAAASTSSDLLRYGLPTAGTIASGIIQSIAAGKASDAQQKYLEEALAYEKEKDAGNIAREAGRYGDFQNNIAPYVQRGNAAGSRMAALLGLPGGAAPSIQPLGGGNASSDPTQYADKLAPEDKAKVDALLKKYNSSDDPNYWYGINALHGGFDTTGADWNEHRISIGDGAGKGYGGVQGAAQYGTQPLPRDAGTPPAAEPAAPEMVTIQAPDGSQRTVTKKDADHYIARGATLVGAAA
jgi:hypothetical protein